MTKKHQYRFKWLVLALCIAAWIIEGQSTFAQDGSGDEDSAIAKAKECMETYILDMEAAENKAVVYVGASYKVLPEQKFSGSFPFVGFRAEKNFRTSSSNRLRFWLLRSEALDVETMFTGFMQHELRIGEDRWYSRAGGPITLYESKSGEKFRFQTMEIDPKWTVLALGGALQLGVTVDPMRRNFFRTNNIVKARKVLRGHEVVIRWNNAWLHVFFDETQDWRPTRAAVTKPDTELKDDFGNATALNFMRWKKNEEGMWMPEFADNAYYFGETLADQKYAIRVTQKIVWVDEKEVPEKVFEKESLALRVEEVQEMFDQWISKASAIESIAERKKRTTQSEK